MINKFPDKTCVRCGRRFAWRKKWARSWSDVKYCSASCRRHKIGLADLAYEQRIMTALALAPRTGISLHELATDHDEVEPLRQAARRLAIAGRIRMIQSGRTIDPRDLHGKVSLVLV